MKHLISVCLFDCFVFFFLGFFFGNRLCFCNVVTFYGHANKAQSVVAVL